jgi:hypothetical protein
MIEVKGNDNYSIWNIVNSEYPKPVQPVVVSSSLKTDPDPIQPGPADFKKELRIWDKGNDFASQAITSNCTGHIPARIGTLETAAEAYKKLQKIFEGKTVMELWALQASITNHHFDDRKTTISEHITAYERSWNTFTATINRTDLTNDDGYGIGLKAISGSDKAKTDYLLCSLPSFYANTVENIRSCQHKYDDVVVDLQEFVTNKKVVKKEGTTADNLIVLNTEGMEKKVKICEYC